MLITFITGSHGTGKFPKALKLAGYSETGFVANWNGKSSVIGVECNARTETLVLHGVNFPEHFEAVRYIQQNPNLPLYTRSGLRYTLNAKHMIICTTDKIPTELQTGNFTIIETEGTK